MSSHRYGDRYLYSSDFLDDQEYKAYKLKISKVYNEGELKTKDGEPIPDKAIGFEQTEKILVLNWVNEEVIHNVLGQKFGDKWVGGEVVFSARVVLHKGEVKPAVRAIPPQGAVLSGKAWKQMGIPIEYGKTYSKSDLK